MSLRRKESLNEVLKGRLPDHIIEAISKLTITIEELDNWKRSQVPRIAISKGKLLVDIQLNVSLKKVFAIASSAFGCIWVVIKFFVEVWPSLQVWLSTKT